MTMYDSLHCGNVDYCFFFVAENMPRMFTCLTLGQFPPSLHEVLVDALACSGKAPPSPAGAGRQTDRDRVRRTCWSREGTVGYGERTASESLGLVIVTTSWCQSCKEFVSVVLIWTLILEYFKPMTSYHKKESGHQNINDAHHWSNMINIFITADQECHIQLQSKSNGCEFITFDCGHKTNVWSHQKLPS